MTENSSIPPSHWLRQAFKITHCNFLQILRRYWVWLVLLGLVSLIFDEAMLQIQKSMNQLDSVPIGWALLLVSLQMLWSVLINAIFIILASVGVEDNLLKRAPTSAWKITTEHLGPLTIESLRALGKSLCWFLLFIIPGVIKYLRYTFVPYIVLYDQKYHRGEVDALKRSEELIKGHTMMIFLLSMAFIGFMLLINTLNQTLTQGFMDNPVGTIISEVFSIGGSLYFATLLFAIYKSRL